MSHIILHKLENFQGGWVAGNFSPTLVAIDSIEIGIKSFISGDSEPCHFQNVSSEYTIVLQGEIMFAGTVAKAGDIVEIPPKVHGSFSCLKDCTLVVLKSPSNPLDKIICEEGH